MNVPVGKEDVCSKATVVLSKEDSQPDALLPLGEEYMLAVSEAKLAEGAAKQIYMIRDSRISLLTADLDKLPADGESYKLMMDGMNKKETELTELFIGKTTKETQIQTVYLIPTKTVANDVLFRLSALKGLVNADDLSGTPYYISINPTDVKKNGSERNSKNEKTGLFYILPASTLITIGDGVNTLLSEQFLIPQFGITIPLDESLFKQKGTKVHIDSQTGQLVRVE